MKSMKIKKILNIVILNCYTLSAEKSIENKLSFDQKKGKNNKDEKKLKLKKKEKIFFKTQYSFLLVFFLVFLVWFFIFRNPHTDIILKEKNQDQSMIEKQEIKKQPEFLEKQIINFCKKTTVERNKIINFKEIDLHPMTLDNLKDCFAVWGDSFFYIDFDNEDPKIYFFEKNLMTIVVVDTKFKLGPIEKDINQHYYRALKDMLTGFYMSVTHEEIHKLKRRFESTIIKQEDVLKSYAYYHRKER